MSKRKEENISFQNPYKKIYYPFRSNYKLYGLYHNEPKKLNEALLQVLIQK